jgi:hypothetical protein
MQKKSNGFQKVGGYKKTQLLLKKGISFQFYTIYLLINQCITLVAFRLRFRCVSYEKNATVALFFENVKNGATKTPSCALFGTLAQPTQVYEYQYLIHKNWGVFGLGCAGCAKKIPYHLKSNKF